MDRILEQRGALARKHGFIHNGSSLDQEHVAGNTTVILCPRDGDKIAGEELVTLDLNPPAQAEHPNIVGFNTHAAEFVQGALALPNYCALEGDQHEEGEKRVVPVLIQHPKTNAEDLKNEEGSHCVLLEELGKCGHGDVESVGAIVLLLVLNRRLSVQTPGRLKRADLGLRLGIDVVGQSREGCGLCGIQEAPLLEEEGDVGTVANLTFLGQTVWLDSTLEVSADRKHLVLGRPSHLVADQSAYLRSAGVCDGNDLYGLGIGDGLCLRRGEERGKANAPMGAKPEDTLDGDDCG